MSIRDRHTAPVPEVLLCDTNFSVPQGQTIDYSRYPIGSSNLASAPNSVDSNSFMGIIGSPAARRNDSGPSSSASTTISSGITTDIHACADLDEMILNRHYLAFRIVLDPGDPKDEQELDKSYNKLLRLTPAQLYELSTDVFDELVRRQALASPNDPPSFLLGNNVFSSRRNQARRKLSAADPPQFRDLVAQVAYEIERRFPHFAGAYLQRTVNHAPIQSDLVGHQLSAPFNRFAPKHQCCTMEPPQAPSMINPRRTDVYRFPAPPRAPNFPRSPGTNGDCNPTSKQPGRDNVNVPKRLSRAGEHNESEGESDEFSLEQAASNCESTRNTGNGVTMEVIEEYKSQLRQFSDRLCSMEDTMENKVEEICDVLDEERLKVAAHTLEKQEWDDRRLDLENKLAEAQALNDSMRQELQQVRQDHESETERLRDEVASSQTKAREAQQVAAQHAAAELAPGGCIEPVESDSFLEQANGSLHYLILKHQRVQRQAMEEVRKEIEGFLREMRALPQRSSSVYERQAEELGQTIKRLEQEVHEWRIRYVRTKEQLRSTCTSSVERGPEHNAVKLDRGKGLVDDHGLVKDTHVTELQTAIAELLHQARTDDSESVIDAVKSVVVSVRQITHDAKVPRGDGEDSAWQRAKLRGEVSLATNSLITASMNYAAGAGLYPLCLLDAAASHLAGAIVDLLRLVKVQTTQAERT